MTNTFRRILLIFLIPLIFFTGCTSDQEKKAAHYQKAAGYFEKEDYKSAELELKNAVQIDPAYLEAQLLLGETSLKLGNGQAAVRAYSAVTQLDPYNLDAHLKMASFYLLSQNVEEARGHVDAVLEAEPENTQGLLLLAGIMEKEGDSPEVMEVYERILKADPKLLQAYWGKARLLARNNRRVEAEAILKEAIDIEPGELGSRLMLFQLYAAQGDFAKAEEALSGAIAQHPENTELLITKAELYNRMNQKDRAEATLKKAIEVAPLEVKPLMAAAGFYDHIGQTEAAGLHYREALELQPENVAVLEAMARHLVRNKNNAEATAYVDKALELQPAYSPARVLRGEILLAEKKDAEALALFSQLATDEPKSALAHYFKGVTLYRKGDSNNAKGALLKSLELNPKLSGARLVLANLYFQEGAYALAERESGEVLAESPDNYQAKLVYGNACLHQKKNREARTAFEGLVEREPDKPVGYYRLGVLLQVMNQHDAARDNFEKALELNPMLMDVFAALIRTEIWAGNPEAALDRCDAQLKAVPVSSTPAAVIHSLRGSIHLSRKDFPSAESAFKEALGQDPNYLKPYYELARIYLTENKQEEAIAQCKALLEKNPHQPATHMMLGTLYQLQEKSDLSETHYRKALEADPEFAPAANNLAYILVEKDLNEALKYARIAKSKLPDNPSVADTLGWIYVKKGLYDNAIRELRDSVERYSENPDVHYHLGMAYAGKQENRLAREMLEKALALSSEFSGSENAKKTLSEL